MGVVLDRARHHAQHINLGSFLSCKNNSLSLLFTKVLLLLRRLRINIPSTPRTLQRDRQLPTLYGCEAMHLPGFHRRVVRGEVHRAPVFMMPQHFEHDAERQALEYLTLIRLTEERINQRMSGASVAVRRDVDIHGSVHAELEHELEHELLASDLYHLLQL